MCTAGGRHVLSARHYAHGRVVIKHWSFRIDMTDLQFVSSSDQRESIAFWARAVLGSKHEE